MNLKDNTEKAGSLCPICNKPGVDPDRIHEICELCGMAIDTPSPELMFKTEEGFLYDFCCERCISIYVNEIRNIVNRIYFL